MSFKWYIFLLFLFGQTSILISQTSSSKDFILKWNDNSPVEISKNQTITLPLVENNFFDGYNNATYSTSFNVENNLIVQQFLIKNVKTSLIADNLTKNLDKTKISTEFKSDFQNK